MNKTALMRAKEAEHGEPLESLLRRLSAQGMNRQQMAAYLGISYFTLTDWFRADRLGVTVETVMRFASEEAIAGAVES